MKAKSKKKKKVNIIDVYQKDLFINMLLDLLAILIGLILYFDTEMAIRGVAIIIGILLIGKGICSIISYIKNKEFSLYRLNIIFGSIAVLIGLFLIAYPMTINNVLNVTVGIWLFVCGINKACTGLSLKKVKEDSWLITLSVGIILLLFALMLIFNPFVKLVLVELIGLFIMVYGAIDFVNLFLLNKRSESFIKLFK